jgi:hypothetical protein
VAPQPEHAPDSTSALSLAAGSDARFSRCSLYTGDSARCRACSWYRSFSPGAGPSSLGGERKREEESLRGSRGGASSSSLCAAPSLCDNQAQVVPLTGFAATGF